MWRITVTCQIVVIFLSLFINLAYDNLMLCQFYYSRWYINNKSSSVKLDIITYYAIIYLLAFKLGAKNIVEPWHFSVLFDRMFLSFVPLSTCFLFYQNWNGTFDKKAKITDYVLHMWPNCKPCGIKGLKNVNVIAKNISIMLAHLKCH